MAERMKDEDPPGDVEAIINDGTDSADLWKVWELYKTRFHIQSTIINRGTNTGNDLLRRVGSKRLAELPEVTDLQALHANRLLRALLERDCWWVMRRLSQDQAIRMGQQQLEQIVGIEAYRRLNGQPVPDRHARPDDVTL